MTYKTELWFKKKLLVLAKSNNVHPWLFWLKKIKKRGMENSKQWVILNSFILGLRMCVYTYLMMGVTEVLRILLYQHHCVLHLDNLGSRKTPHLSSSHLLPHYWYFSFAILAPPSTNTPPHVHLNIFPHLIPVYLGFKVMLCVQSKQKKVEYQQSFIKQLMGFYSAGTNAGRN